MTYTFLHRGNVIGTSKLATRSKRARQRIDVFYPTPYGKTLMPRVTCVHATGIGLKAELDALRRPIENMNGEEINKIISESIAGQAMIDVGRVLSEVELHAPDGRRLDFASIAFSNLQELAQLGKALGGGAGKQTRKAQWDGREFLVSVTLMQEPPSVSRSGGVATQDGAWNVH